jgi:hypothetical protein
MMTTFLLLYLALGASASGRPVRPASAWALVVAGISRDSEDRAVRDQTLNDLQAYLIECAKVDPRRLVVLAPERSQPSTAVSVGQAMTAFASDARSEDRFVFYYIGQANAVGGELRFNLPGPDMTDKDLANRLDAVKAGHQLVVLDCPCAALAAKPLADDNRIVVCASTATQVFGTRFSPHFIRALTDPQSDADHDGRVSVLEAFTTAVREIERWYHEQAILPTETPCLEDDGDGTPSERPWRYRTEGGDGARASTFLLAEGL